VLLTTRVIPYSLHLNHPSIALAAPRDLSTDLALDCISLQSPHTSPNVHIREQEPRSTSSHCTFSLPQTFPQNITLTVNFTKTTIRSLFGVNCFDGLRSVAVYSTYKESPSIEGILSGNGAGCRLADDLRHFHCLDCRVWNLGRLAQHQRHVTSLTLGLYPTVSTIH
jgi:hypothetical protein